MKTLSKETLQRLREEFPQGCLVALVEMNDPQAPPVGTVGKVKWVDDTGTIHVAWNTGGSLGVIFGVDSCRKLEG